MALNRQARRAAAKTDKANAPLSPGQQNRLAQLREKASKKYKAGDYSQALTHLEAMQKIAPTDTKILAFSALTAIQSKEYNRALKALRKEAKLYQRAEDDNQAVPAQSYHALAQGFSEAQSYEEAQSALENAVRANRAQRLGAKSASEKNAPLAFSELLVDEVSQSGQTAILLDYVQILNKQKQFQNAAQLGQALLKTKPKDIEIIVALASAHFQNGQFKDAGDLYERALNSAPGRHTLFNPLIACLFHLGRTTDALKYCEDWLKRSPGNIEALAMKTVAAIAAENKELCSELLDFDRFVKCYKVAAPENYDDIDQFNAALEKHILKNPTLQTPDEDHPTWHHLKLKISDELLRGNKGPVGDLEKIMHDKVQTYLNDMNQGDAHPFLEHMPSSFNIASWAALLDGEGNQQPHIHIDGYLSGCYYVRIPDEIQNQDMSSEAAPAAPQGGFEIGRPPPELGCDKPVASKAIKPEEGLMVLFPAYMYHGTIPFHSDTQRICIAFDVLPEKRS